GHDYGTHSRREWLNSSSHNCQCDRHDLTGMHLRRRAQWEQPGIAEQNHHRAYDLSVEVYRQHRAVGQVDAARPDDQRVLAHGPSEFGLPGRRYAIDRGAAQPREEDRWPRTRWNTLR